MNSHGITTENLLRALPVALQGDASVSAIAEVAADLLANRLSEIDLLRIYADIDRLPEELLDLLAYDFKIDWWDGDYSLEQKRRVFRDSFLVHRRLGTRWAVETALDNVFPGATVQEWFEYGGEPYRFRVNLPVSADGLTEEQQRRAVSRVWYYKNLRSHMDDITLSCESTAGTCSAAYTSAVVHTEVWPQIVTQIESTANSTPAGFMVAKQSAEIWPSEE